MECPNFVPQSVPEEEKQFKNSQFGENEVNLVEYFLIFWKRKWSVMIIFMIIVSAAVAINLLIPEIFESTALIKIGVLKKIQIEPLVDIQTVFANENILSQIKTNAQLAERMNVHAVADLFDITADEENPSNLILIKGRGESPEKAVLMVNAIVNIMLNRQQALFKEAATQYDVEVAVIKRDQQKTEQDIARIELEIKRLDQDINYYQAEINKRGNAQSEAQGRIAESYINLLANVKSRREGKISDKQILRQKLDNFDAVFQQKEFEKAYETRPTEVTLPPILPQTKIAPARRKNVMIAAVLAALLSVIYAFAAEYVSAYRKKIKPAGETETNFINS